MQSKRNLIIVSATLTIVLTACLFGCQPVQTNDDVTQTATETVQNEKLEKVEFIHLSEGATSPFRVALVFFEDGRWLFENCGSIDFSDSNILVVPPGGFVLRSLYAITSGTIVNGQKLIDSNTGAKYKVVYIDEKAISVIQTRAGSSDISFIGDTYPTDIMSGTYSTDGDAIQANQKNQFTS